MRVHALLTQHSNFGRAPVAIYGAATSSLISNEVLHSGPDRRRLISPGAPGRPLRVVTQALHLPGSFCPPDTNVVRLSLNTVCPLAVITKRSRKPPAQHNGRNQQAHAVPVRFNCFTVSGTNLNHRPQFFVNNAARRSSPRVAISASMPQCQQRPFPPALPAGRHQSGRGSEQLTLCYQRLNRVIEAFQLATSRTSAGLSPS